MGTTQKYMFIIPLQSTFPFCEFTSFGIKGLHGQRGLTPSEAAIMDCRFGIESALSIFGMTCISALAPGYETSTKHQLGSCFPA